MRNPTETSKSQGWTLWNILKESKQPLLSAKMNPLPRINPGRKHLKWRLSINRAPKTWTTMLAVTKSRFQACWRAAVLFTKVTFIVSLLRVLTQRPKQTWKLWAISWTNYSLMTVLDNLKIGKNSNGRSPKFRQMQNQNQKQVMMTMTMTRRLKVMPKILWYLDCCTKNKSSRVRPNHASKVLSWSRWKSQSLKPSSLPISSLR